MLSPTQGPFAEIEDQDQTEQIDKEMFWKWGAVAM